MKRFWLAVILGGWLALCGTAARAQADPATAEALMRASGLWQQLGTMSQQVRSSMGKAAQGAGAPPDAAALERLDQAAAAAYDAERLRGNARAALAQVLDPRHLPAVQRWLGSALGAAIARLESSHTEATAGEDQQTAVKRGIEILQQASPGRRATLERMVVVTQAPQALATITLNTALATANGVRSVRPSAPGPTLAELKAQLQAQRPQLEQAFEVLVLAGFARTYESLADNDLNTYLRFMETEAGRHYHDAEVQALDQALTEAATEMGRRLPGTAPAAQS